MSGLNEISRGRRFVLAAFTCALAAGLFHGEVASALVSRGDDFLTRGDTLTALRYYERAIRVDRESHNAVDRYVFFSAESHNMTAIRDAVAVASRYLARHAADSQVLMDRGLCYNLLKEYGPAERDFARAAHSTRSARDFTLAGWASLRVGRSNEARELWRDALEIEPAYTPARHALSKLSR